MRKLIAALEQIRARLNVVIADLEGGEADRAVEELRSMQDDFRSSVADLIDEERTRA